MSDGRAVVLCSGGLDSSCLVAYLKSSDRRLKVYPVFVDRGQRAVAEERQAYVAVCEYLRIDAAQRVELSYDISSADRFRDDRDERFRSKEHVKHPERNLVLTALAYGVGALLRAPKVYVGCNLDDDHEDCNRGFFKAVNGVLGTLNPNGKVFHPFIDMDWGKANIVRWAAKCPDLGLRFLSLTHTCWKPGDRHCGTCGACGTRIAAFAAARVEDPTEYAARSAK